MASKKFVRGAPRLSEAIGEVDPDKLNVKRRLDRHRPSVRGDRRADRHLDAP